MKLERKDVIRLYNELKQKNGRCTLADLTKEAARQGYINPYTRKPYSYESIRYHLTRDFPNYRYLNLQTETVILVVDPAWSKTSNWLRSKLVDYVEMSIDDLDRKKVDNMIVAGNSVPAWVANYARLIYIVKCHNRVIQSDDEFEEETAEILVAKLRSIYD